MEENFTNQGKKYLKRNEILILIQAIGNYEIELINSYIDDKQLKDKIQKICDEDRIWDEINKIEKNYLANIAAQISQEDYPFLESKINTKATIDLICATGNTEFIKKCIETLDISDTVKVFLVSGTKDEKYIKDFFYKNKDNLQSWQKTNLITATRDNDFKMQCVDDESLQLEDNLRASIIASTGNIKYIKEAIESRKFDLDSTWDLIEATKDSKYIEDKIENSDLKLSSRQLVVRLKNIDDETLINKYLNSSKLEIKDKIELIQAKRIKTDVIKQFINANKESIDRDNLIKLVTLTRDPDYIYIAIRDEKLGLTEKEKSKIILQTKNKALIEKYMKETPNLDENDKKIFEFILNPDELSLKREQYKKIELPEEMTIGIEIESEGEYSAVMPKLILNGRWRSKSDNSLENGTEIVSTILTGSKQDSKEIYQICDFLENIGQTTSNRCGAHVHIGADYLTNTQAYINLLEIFGNCEEIIYTISNASDNNIRNGVSQHCSPIAVKLEEALKNGKINSKAEMSEFIEQIQIIQEDRCSGINFMNIGTSKSTVEYRTPNGTIDPNIWIENINLFGGMVKIAQELSLIQEKSIEEMTQEDKLKLMHLNIIKSKDVNPNEKLDALLLLTVKDKELYIERYEKNIVLIQQDEEIINTMQKARPSQPIDIRKIGKSILTGEDAVRGEEAAKLEATFYRDVEQVKEGKKVL